MTLSFLRRLRFSAFVKTLASGAVPI